MQGLPTQDVDVLMELLDQNPRGGQVDIVTTMIVTPNTNLLGGDPELTIAITPALRHSCEGASQERDWRV